MSAPTAPQASTSAADPWSRHPMVQLRATLPPGARFEQVEQVEGFDSEGVPFRELVLHDGPPPPVLLGAVPAPAPSPTVAPELLDALDQADPAALLPVVLWLRADAPWDEASVTSRVEHGLFDGQVVSQDSYLNVRDDALVDRGAVATDRADAFLAAHPELAAAVVERAAQAPMIAIELRPDQVTALLDDPALEALDLDEATSTLDSTMSDYLDMMGVRPFHDMGYEAATYRTGGAAPIQIAQFEPNVPWAAHPGFKSSGTGGRRTVGYDCTTSGTYCSTVLPSAANAPLIDGVEGEHPTAVAGILIGDDTRGQDTVIATNFPGASYLLPITSSAYINAMNSYLEKHSGIARQSYLRSYALGNGRTWVGSRMGKAFDTLRLQPIPANIANMSASYDAYRTRFPWQTPVPNPTCTSTSAMVKLVNTYYEDGGLFFKSAGNWGDPLTYTTEGYAVPACTVGEPGGALSAMTIGGVDGAYPIGSVLRATSSSYSDPSGRALVKLAAPRILQYPYRKFGPVAWNTAHYGPSDEDPQGVLTETYEETYAWGGTSFSAPAAAAAAAVYRDWYVNEASTFLDDPGMLAAALLLMGDRYAGDGSRLDSGFDSELGAGFLKLETSTPGDPTVSTATSYHKLCLGSSWETHVVRGSSTVLQLSPTEVNASLWWYDVDHDEGGALTNFDLSLVRRTPTSQTIVRTSRSTRNNMERIHYDLPVGDSWSYYYWRVDPVGAIPADHICASSTRVYLAQNRKMR